MGVIDCLAHVFEGYEYVRMKNLYVSIRVRRTTKRWTREGAVRSRRSRQTSVQGEREGTRDARSRKDLFAVSSLRWLACCLVLPFQSSIETSTRTSSRREWKKEKEEEKEEE